MSFILRYKTARSRQFDPASDVTIEFITNRYIFILLVNAYYISSAMPIDIFILPIFNSVFSLIYWGSRNCLSWVISPMYISLSLLSEKTYSFKAAKIYCVCVSCMCVCVSCMCVRVSFMYVFVSWLFYLNVVLSWRYSLIRNMMP